MPVHHTVLFKLLPSLTAANRLSLHETIMAGLANTPGKNGAGGPPMFTDRAGGFDYGITREFIDEAEFQAYRIHPNHMELVHGVLAESVESMVSFQIQA